MIKFHLLNRCSHGIHNSTISGQLGCCSAVFRRGDRGLNTVIWKRSHCLLSYYYQVFTCIIVNSKRKRSQEIEMERLIWKKGHAKETVLRAEEKRWSRRWRDALSWFISTGNKLGISPPACLICEYAEHPTPDSSPLIKAWLGAQVAIAHLYENTWWWFYTESSFRMEPMCQSRDDTEKYTQS